MEVERGVRTRRIKLSCPSVSSKIVQIIASDDQKLDLGSIAREFGLDPNTLKLNGHFISRGIDLIASSVTWKSLISFFSARLLPTGSSDSDTLLVDGKLCKTGSKRPHNSEGNEIPKANEREYIRNHKKPQLDYAIRFDSKEHSDTVVRNGLSGSGSKRKLQFEDRSHLKKLRSDKTVSGPAEKSCFDSTNSILSCSFISKRLKRMMVDEMLAVAPLKKTK